MFPKNFIVDKKQKTQNNYKQHNKLIKLQNKPEIHVDSVNNKLNNSSFITNIKKTHEEGNCICFILTLIFYLIGSIGKKYNAANTTANATANTTNANHMKWMNNNPEWLISDNNL